MKELPQKIKQPEERTMHGTLVVTHLSPTELKINELIDYLESQKEGELTGAGANWLEEGEEVNPCLHEAAGWPHNSTCLKTKEEPKQIDVDVMLFEYTTLHAQPDWTRKDYQRMQEIINTLKQALQQ